MNSTDLIELLQSYEEEEGGPITVQVLVRSDDRNMRFNLDHFDVSTDESPSGTVVLIDLS